ncbi:MAG: 16S rRNA (guanine(527)-N(7))-methyltransferase RsmG [Candidatus Kapabacteria bacterium]|nr:16S rRNA (guanine(527)-N(7))-methyltransferase RsmG [Candidatus Kapabacteria bacterium]
MDLAKFWTTCSSNSIVLTLEQLKSIERYHDELKYWNAKVNMISRKDEDNILERHILHSLSIVKYVDFRPKDKIIDVGTGGGLPGIPVKIACPGVDMLLIDSINKKVKVAKMLAQHTGLRKIEAMCIRAETLAEDLLYRKKFDYVLSRAVAKLDIIAEWTSGLLKKNGTILLLKGGDLTEEIEAARIKYPNLSVKEIMIDLVGLPFFREEGKKLLICKFN